jgi:hypothetical protein
MGAGTDAAEAAAAADVAAEFEEGSGVPAVVRKGMAGVTGGVGGMAVVRRHVLKAQRC